MCTSILVCHGDKHELGDYTEKHKSVVIPKHDHCKPASYYITSDGRYAIDSEFVDIDKLDELDFDKLPKIKLKD